MFDLPYSRFCQLQELLFKIREEEIRESYVLQAFNAFLMGAGQKKNLKQFLKHLGLDEKKTTPKQQQMSKEEAKQTVKRNIANAQQILLLDRMNRKQKEG
ncbi:hypothetical protein [Priestia megaterium]|uniref:hypothetical protein n=1 Tax=Priestia megaterium TaxID=1404 RepID=UPI002E1A1EE7|nr:hypothetical protein [Priestia megaterium]